MQSVVKSQAFLRKRKMMMVLPLLVIPFVTLAFYALGGGKAHAGNRNIEAMKGLNLKLPDVASREDRLMDKLEFYEKAWKDSMQLAEWMRSDPYYKATSFASDTAPNEVAQIHQSVASKYRERLNVSPYEKATEAPEEKIMQKISLLQKEMNKNAVSSNQEPKINSGQPGISGQVDRLEDMMQQMNKVDGNQGDTEISQLANTLDKILDVQHPERVKDRLKEKSLKEKKTVFPVSTQPREASISLLGQKESSSSENGFYGLNDESISPDQNAIEAVIHESRTLVNGSVVKIRLLSDAYVAGQRIPKGSFVFGIAALNNERLNVEISSIQYESSLYPVKLQVYDLDGNLGIYIPGAITREVAKQSADNSLQLMELSTMDPSLKAQATTAGINAAKSLLSKKVKLVKVMVKAGYRVLLKANSELRFSN